MFQQYRLTNVNVSNVLYVCADAKHHWAFRVDQHYNEYIRTRTFVTSGCIESAIMQNYTQKPGGCGPCAFDRIKWNGVQLFVVWLVLIPDISRKQST